MSMLESHHTCFLSQHKRQGKIKKNIKLYILWNYFSFTIFETQSELKVKQCPYCSWLGEGGIQYIYRQEQRLDAREEGSSYYLPLCGVSTHGAP